MNLNFIYIFVALYASLAKAQLPEVPKGIIFIKK